MEIYISEAIVESEGVLRVDHLPFHVGQRVHVELTPVDSAVGEWPEEYFSSTFGAIADETFVRAPQGQFENRESFP